MPTNLNPPGGGDWASVSSLAASKSFVASGACSGNVRIDEQSLQVVYSATTGSYLAGDWPDSCRNTSGLLCDVYGYATRKKEFYATSGLPTANEGDYSGCRSAANGKLMQQVYWSAMDQTTPGMGKFGILETSTIGWERTWWRLGDTEFSEYYDYGRVWIPTAKGYDGWQTNADLARTLIKRLIVQLVRGGLYYESLQGRLGSARNIGRTGAWTNFRTDLIDGWTS